MYHWVPVMWQMSKQGQEPSQTIHQGATGAKGGLEGLMLEACTAQLEMELHVKDQEIQSLKVRLWLADGFLTLTSV